MELLLLVIPFEDTGAMETFLLNAIANDSAYDAEIIRKGNQFVEEVDKERKYLTKRRYITKSKFDVYFSIRTAAEQLGDISCLKSVCVGTKNTSDLAVKGLRHYFGSRNLEVRVRKSEIPLRY